MNKSVYRHIIAMVLAMVLLRGHRTLGNMSRLYLYSRHKSSISRCLSESVFPGFIMQEHLYNRFLKEALEIPGAKRMAYIIIDTTANRKRSGKSDSPAVGGPTMDNRIIYKKGYTSTHFFVILYTFPTQSDLQQSRCFILPSDLYPSSPQAVDVSQRDGSRQRGLRGQRLCRA